MRPAAAAACATVLIVSQACSTDRSRSRNVLAAAWDSYKTSFIRADGNVVDPDRGGGDTTSEGQGYALLRAAWMRDRETFFRVFRWTERHLARPDGLYSWLWSPAGGGRVMDANTAADADQEIAFALIIASSVFEEPRFLERAKTLVQSIRQHERIDIGAGWFPAAGNWAVSERIANLSYFVPYAYPYFARVDPDGRWESVVETGYDLIDKALRTPSARLIPDFMAVSPDGALALPPDAARLSSDFSSDAMRVYWRVAVDCQLHSRTRACGDQLGSNNLTAMLAGGALFTRYSVAGLPLERVESLSFYGAALPFLQIHDMAAAKRIRTKQLSEDVVRFALVPGRRYFDANWVWFGLAAADGLIVARTPPL